MSLLSDLKEIMGLPAVDLPVSSGVYKDKAPASYVVLTPLADTFDCSDDKPETDVQNVRISLFTKENYTQKKNAICRAVIAAGITITGRQHIAPDDDTDYHNYAIDVEKEYSWEE